MGAGWFFIALVGPLMYAATNHIDKLLIERHFKGKGVETLLIFSALLSGLALPFLFVADPTPFEVSPIHILALAVVGVLNVFVLFFYLKALEKEEASVAVVFYQLVPVFGYVLGYILLNEILTVRQIVAMAIVICGTSIISFEIDEENRFKLRKRTVSFMTLAAFLWALESVIFKYVALEERVWRSLFWEHIALALAGLFIFVSMRTYRAHFIGAVRHNSAAILSLNVLNESLYMIGNVAVSYAYLLAPIALVLLAESYQPLFVFAFGIFLTCFFPKITAERIAIKHLGQKFLAIVVTGLGTYLLLVG